METYFTSDLHFFHKNILKHCPSRLEVCGASSEDDVELWDEWLLKKWNDTIGKKDQVYILGDLAFGSIEQKVKLVQKLHGKKFLIVGNHDTTPSEFTKYFVEVTQIKEVRFKQKNYPGLLEEDFRIICCHYPMITWSSKHHGVVAAHGHCHGRLDKFNEESPDLRVDVGIDGKLANFNFIKMEELYKYFKEKAGNKLFKDYVEENRQKLDIII